MGTVNRLESPIRRFLAMGNVYMGCIVIWVNFKYPTFDFIPWCYKWGS